MYANTQNPIYRSVFIFSFLLLCIFSVNCGQNLNTDAKIDNDKRSVDLCESLPYVAIYSQLTYEKFQSVRADTDQIADISISFGYYKNYDQQYASAQEWMFLHMSASPTYRSGASLSTFTDIKGSYKYDRVDVTPEIHEKKKHVFSASAVNDLIFDYLEEDDNENYFFDGSEYTGLPQPYESPDIHIADMEHSYFVTIAFREPGTIYNKWAISKSTDTENPDTILAGLIDILENDFIGQFE